MPLSLRIGSVPFISSESLPFANIKSSSATSLKSTKISCEYSAVAAERAIRIFSISCCSLFLKSRISLLAFTTPIGSTKRVSPVAEVSCTIPGTSDLYSALTGMTYLSERIVTIGS